MKLQTKSKEQMKSEMARLRRRITELETSEIERKRAEKALKESEERYRHIFEHSPLGIGIADLDGKVITANRAMQTITGYSIEDLQKISLAETYENPEDRKTLLKAIRRYGCVTDFPVRLKRKDGTLYDALLNISVINLGGRYFLHTICQDVTDRKKADETLRESEERFRKIADEATFEGIIIHDGKKILDINKAFAVMYGYGRDELIGMNPLETIAPGSRDVVLKHTKEEYEGLYETVALKKDGSTFPIEVRAKSIPFNGRMVKGVAVRDITERKQVEEELRGEALIYENIHDGIIMTDLEGNIIRWNPAAEMMFGYLKDDIVRKTLGVLATRIIKGTLHDGRWFGEIIFTRKDGTEGVCETVVIPLRDEDGAITALFGVNKDITERKQAEDELKQSFEKLQRALEGTVSALASAVEMKDPYTAGHQRRVAVLADAIAHEMKISEHQIEGIRLAGLIHDLGKINVPAEILSKPGRISEIEFNIIKIHPQAAYDALKTIDFPWPVAQIVLQHHERVDGSGYPQGIPGNEIIVEAKILAVADVVEAMASDRPYRPALGVEAAMEEIHQKRGILYDSQAVDACLRLFKEKGFSPT